LVVGDAGTETVALPYEERIGLLVNLTDCKTPAQVIGTCAGWPGRCGQGIYHG